MELGLTLRVPLEDGEDVVVRDVESERRDDAEGVPLPEFERLARGLADPLTVVVLLFELELERLFVAVVVEERETLVEVVCVRELVVVFVEVVVAVAVLEVVDVLVEVAELVDDLEEVEERVDVVEAVEVELARAVVVCSEDGRVERVVNADLLAVRVLVDVRVGNAACTARSRPKGWENSTTKFVCARGGGSAGGPTPDPTPRLEIPPRPRRSKSRRRILVRGVLLVVHSIFRPREGSCSPRGFPA